MRSDFRVAADHQALLEIDLRNIEGYVLHLLYQDPHFSMILHRIRQYKCWYFYRIDKRGFEKDHAHFLEN